MTKSMENQKQKEKKYSVAAITRYVFALGVRKNPVLLFLFLIATIGAGVCSAMNVRFKQTFFDSVESLVRGETAFLAAVALGVIMAAFMIFSFVLEAAGNLFQENFFRSVEGQMGKQLNDKASKIDPVVYEDNRFLDHINKAYRGLEAAAQIAASVLYIGFSDVVYFVSMGFYIFTVEPMLLVTFCAAFLPSFFSASLRRRMFMKLENQSAPYRRRYEYFEKCLCSREYAKETRLWRAEPFFKHIYNENLDEGTRLDDLTQRKAGLINLGVRLLALVGYVGMIIQMFYYLYRGVIGVGAFAAVFSSLDQMFGRMEGTFNYRVGSIVRSYGAAANFFAFLDLPQRRGEDESPLKRERMELRDVSFTYPSAERPALEHINLTIRKGETIAIVGVNGSGKSTLTRLLLGLYLPTEGAMTVDGKDTREISPKALYQGASAVFQKYQSYKMTVRDNVKVSDQESGEDVDEALVKADFSMDTGKFAEGLETMLGKDFGGIDLSGGQWQRLAIARGLYRVHDMIVLDEPTAAIDPLEEADIYRKFADISKGRTAFIVTHRLGSAKIADRIIVMDAGHIVDMGSHEELMSREGKYKEMYQAQAKWYV